MEGNSTLAAIIVAIIGLVIFFLMPGWASSRSKNTQTSPTVTKWIFRVVGLVMIGCAIYIYSLGLQQGSSRGAKPLFL